MSVNEAAQKEVPSPPFDVCCPKCGSLIGEPCRALTSGRVTDIHETRFMASWKWRVANGY